MQMPYGSDLALFHFENSERQKNGELEEVFFYSSKKMQPIFF
jgi:hypothetical protein